MQETKTISIRVTLPPDIAAQAEELARTEPDYLSRAVLLAMMRWSIYRHGDPTRRRWGDRDRMS